MGACTMLRAELRERASKYAIAKQLPHSLSYGERPAVCFEPFGEELHGNFHPASYKRICSRPDWKSRLAKVHTTARRSLPRPETGSRAELDSCMSSDALLMNIFCHPSVLRSESVAQMLGVESRLLPQFGLRARVPLTPGRVDSTEVDMQIGDLLVEAKLTESDFQRVEKARMIRYRDFLAVFDEPALPQTERHYHSYQLLRNVLAAHDRHASFCVLLDARRSDLLEAWYAVMRCVRAADLRTACKVLTWQELARALPKGLQYFLAQKYGVS
jgi:Restriction Endonuclease associating with ARP